jgi:hypothetical protein
VLLRKQVLPRFTKPLGDTSFNLACRDSTCALAILFVRHTILTCGRFNSPSVEFARGRQPISSEPPSPPCPRGDPTLGIGRTELLLWVISVTLARHDHYHSNSSLSPLPSTWTFVCVKDLSHVDLVTWARHDHYYSNFLSIAVAIDLKF